MVCFFIILKKHKTFQEPIKYNQIKNYITQINKKRNNDNYLNKYASNIIKNNNNILNYKKKYKYKKLSRSYLYFSLQNLNKKQNYITYVEYINKSRLDKIIKISQNVDNKINSDLQKYRCIDNICIVETIAKSFAYAILVEENFNIFNTFEKLCSETKIYKKEAKILKYLIISELILNYKKLQNDILKLKKDIIKCTNIRKCNKNLSFAKIYGISLFNSSSSKFIKNSNVIIEATNFVLYELDQILYKQKIISNYIFYLYKKQ